MYVFVGDRRSQLAIRRGFTWIDGRLAAATLFDALRALGLEPLDHSYVNAHDDAGRVDLGTLHSVAADGARGDTVVALGQRASRALARLGVPHLSLVHPAARGRIRKTARYRAHVAAVLAGEAS